MVLSKTSCIRFSEIPALTKLAFNLDFCFRSLDKTSLSGLLSVLQLLGRIPGEACTEDPFARISHISIRSRSKVTCHSSNHRWIPRTATLTVSIGDLHIVCGVPLPACAVCWHMLVNHLHLACHLHRLPGEGCSQDPSFRAPYSPLPLVERSPWTLWRSSSPLPSRLVVCSTSGGGVQSGPFVGHPTVPCPWSSGAVMLV